MNTKKLLPIAIIAALPMGATAQNISGAMYTAPTTADPNHPAPTTNAGAPYGRIDIDTTDQDHIASTAYVKGAYNSVIAAVNKVADYKQNQLVNVDTGDYIAEVEGAETMFGLITDGSILTASDLLLSADAVWSGIISQRAEVYTNWDDDTEKIDVAFKTVVPQQE